MEVLALFYIAVLCGSFCTADIYLQFPPGSNNRLYSRARDLNGHQQRRLFNSQNNNRGGYNCGSLKFSIPDTSLLKNGNLEFYGESKLKVAWTNQHEAGGEKTKAMIVLQYMVRDDVTDGVVDGPSRDTDLGCDITGNCDTDVRFGRHESFESYKCCSARARKFTFVADQNLAGKTAIYTRQNPQGTRYGYECPEERENYPYPFPTDWKDIAIFTDNVENCRKNIAIHSQNVKDKPYCEPPENYKAYLRKLDDRGIRHRINHNQDKHRIPMIPVTQEECEGLKYKEENFTWVTTPNKHGMGKPICVEIPKSKINHNGLGENGEFNSYEIDLHDRIRDDDYDKPLVLRIRYFINSDDCAKVESDTECLLHDEDLGINDLDEDAKKERGFTFTTNPIMNLFDNIDSKLQLAFNTQQVGGRHAFNGQQLWGRVFQDRSHTLVVRTPEEPINTIHNVNVMGKTGNIVQVYPAVEYAFWPDHLTVCVGDYIHFQWTGSKTNSRGEDYSNIILLRTEEYCKKNDEKGCLAASVPAKVEESFLGFDEKDKWELALDALEKTYHSQKLQAKEVGTFNFVCTRNNNFSNRSHKGTLIVKSCPQKKRDNARDDALKDIEKRFHEHVNNLEKLGK